MLPALKNLIRKTVERTLHQQLPGMIERLMVENFDKFPDRQLTEIGFRWAWSLAIKSYWPDVHVKEAARWLDDYIPSRFGDEEYDWSASAARELAHGYVMEYGE